MTREQILRKYCKDNDRVSFEGALEAMFEYEQFKNKKYKEFVKIYGELEKWVYYDPEHEDDMKIKFLYTTEAMSKLETLRVELEKHEKSPQNVKELIELIKRYESITLKEIAIDIDKDEYIDGRKIARRLTGFGSIETCTLCQKVGYDSINDNPFCNHCVFEHPLGCTSSDVNNECNKTYFAIFNAESPKELLQAFHNRAKYLFERFKELIPDNIIVENKFKWKGRYK